MRLLREIYELLESELRESTVVDLAVSFPYTGVLLDGGRLGVCFTVLEGRGERRDPPPGEARGRRADELARLAFSPTGIESSIGVAALSAAADPREFRRADPLDEVELRPDDRVCVLGGFPQPYLDRIGAAVAELWVLERPPKVSRGVLPDWAVEELAPRCTVLFATGSTIPNKTLERALELSSDARERIVVGPSVPMVPGPFQKRGVTVLAGVRFTDPQSAMRVVAEGGGTRDLRPHSEKALIRLRR